MADTKGTESKPTETKSGPVRPPVLDLTAREAGADKPDVKAETKPAPARETPPRPTSPPPAAPAAGFAFGAAATGGVLGLAAAYGLAWFGLWPTPAVAPPPAADPRLAQFATAIPELETVTQTTQSEMATLNQRIAALESAKPVAPAVPDTQPVDLSSVETDIAALATRIDELSTAPAPSADIGSLQDALAAITTRLDEVAARVGTTEAGLRNLDTAVSATTATLAAQPGDIGAVLQLPLILSGFETAFDTGRPYAAELAALRAAVPDAAVPTAIANNAENGLPRPDVIASRFAAVLPAMLAGKPANPDAQWQDGALDWFRSAIAFRPTGEIEGDTPDAVMSRLEGAIARRDFLAAQSLLTSLPAPMLAAGEDVPALVGEQAEAARFLDTLRASALAGEVAK